MIQFERRGTEAIIKVLDGPLGKTWVFVWDCRREEYAALLSDYFSRKLDEEVSKV